MAEFVNAAPRFIDRGTLDNSIKTAVYSPDPIGYYVPLVYIQAEKGPTSRMVVSSAKLAALYGSKTFDTLKPYYNHQTRYLEVVAGTGATCMVQRVVPDDATKSNITLYMDVLETNIPNYKRNSDGSLVLDGTGTDYEVDDTTPEIPGFKIKWITSYDNTVSKTGTRTVTDGYQEKDGVKSKLYPILEFMAANPGEYYNNIGFKIVTLDPDSIDTAIVENTGSLPYGLSIVKRNDSKSSPVIFKTLYGENQRDFVWTKSTKHPTTGAVIDFDTILGNNWYNESNTLLPLVYKDFSGAKFYRNNYENLLKQFMAKEKAYVKTDIETRADGKDSSTLEWFDYKDGSEETLDGSYNLLNPFTTKSINGVKYFTLELSEEALVNKTDDNANEVNVSTNTPIWLNGGSDGTISNENFEKAVVSKMNEYLDSNSEVQDLAINVESSFTDTGFTLDTKKELTSFIGLRKDTILILSTHIDGDDEVELSEHKARAVALKTRINLVPESNYFGTPVCRAVVVMGNMEMADGSSEKRVPLSLEVAYKAARMMGAGTGEWKSSYIFDKAPVNILALGTDYSPKFIPDGVKASLWNDNLVWAEAYNRSTYQIPALQTTYPDDTSILNSMFSSVALTVLTKIAAKAWREFRGDISLTAARFVDRVKAYLDNETRDIFGDLFVVVWDVEIDASDEANGFSWHMTAKLGGNNMKTVAIFQKEAYRMSDLLPA